MQFGPAMAETPRMAFQRTLLARSQTSLRVDSGSMVNSIIHCRASSISEIWRADGGVNLTVASL